MSETENFRPHIEELDFWDKVYGAAIRLGESPTLAAKLANEATRIRRETSTDKYFEGT